MSAMDLIKLAASKGIAVGREKSGVYYWDRGDGNRNTFRGTWSQFVKHVKSM